MKNTIPTILSFFVKTMSNTTVYITLGKDRIFILQKKNVYQENVIRVNKGIRIIYILALMY